MTETFVLQEQVKCYLIPTDKIIPIGCTFTSIKKSLIETNIDLTYYTALNNSDFENYIRFNDLRNNHILVDKNNKVILRNCYIIRMLCNYQPIGYSYTISIFAFNHELQNEQVFDSWLFDYLTKFQTPVGGSDV